MVRIGTVKQTTIWPPLNASGRAGVRMILVRFGPTDTSKPGFQKWVQFIPQAGEDVIPPVGSIIAMVESHELLMGTATFDNVAPDPHMNIGEKELYSSDGNGAKLARHKMKQNGKHLISNTSYDLQTQMHNLTAALSSLVSDLTTFATGLNPTTLAAQASTLAGLLPALGTSINNVQTALDALLDNAP